MEGSVPDKLRLVQANSYVLWTYKFTSHFSMDDERHFQRPHCLRSGNHLPQQYSYHVQNKEGALLRHMVIRLVTGTHETEHGLA